MGQDILLFQRIFHYLRTVKPVPPIWEKDQLPVPSELTNHLRSARKGLLEATRLHQSCRRRIHSAISRPRVRERGLGRPSLNAPRAILDRRPRVSAQHCIGLLQAKGQQSRLAVLRCDIQQMKVGLMMPSVKQSIRRRPLAKKRRGRLLKTAESTSKTNLTRLKLA